MHDISATCPICRTTNLYGAELSGRYTLCTTCRTRFYIEVPPLPGADKDKAAMSSEPIAPGKPVPSLTLEDLLCDTQQGNRFVIQSLWRLESRLRWHSYGMVGLLALATVILALIFAAAA